MRSLSFPGARGLALGFQGMHEPAGVCSSLSGIGAAAASQGCWLLWVKENLPIAFRGEKRSFIAGENGSRHLGGLEGIQEAREGGEGEESSLPGAHWQREGGKRLPNSRTPHPAMEAPARKRRLASGRTEGVGNPLQEKRELGWRVPEHPGEDARARGQNRELPRGKAGSSPSQPENHCTLPAPCPPLALGAVFGEPPGG